MKPARIFSSRYESEEEPPGIHLMIPAGVHPRLLSLLQRKVTFCIPASASSLELIRALGRRSVCRLSIRQLDGFGVSRLLLQEVGHAHK